MQSEDILAFIERMGWSDAEARRQLGIGSQHTLVSYKQNGGPLMLGLACAALAHGLRPWKDGMIKVYQYRKYDAQSGQIVASEGKATREWITKIRAEPIEASELEVEPESIDAEGRYLSDPLPDRENFYLKRLLRWAGDDTIQLDWLSSETSDTSHIYGMEGGDRAALLRLFLDRCPDTDRSRLIVKVWTKYL